MSMIERTYRLNGVSPLLMHNGQLADPIGEIVRDIKAITGKRTKTDADHENIARLEFLGGLYVDEKGRPVIPAENLEGCIVKAAKASKQGISAQTGVTVDGNLALEYDGPNKAEALWEDKRFVDRRSVVVQRNRVFRTRPIFRAWSAVVKVLFRDDVVNPSTLDKWMRKAGMDIGLCDMRPKFGRFDVEVMG